VHLNYLCALNGVIPPTQSERFHYCELGCGDGATTLSLAACYPLGRFWGIDLNPSHIAKAESLAHEAGLDNVTFIAADVATYDRSLLPNFDYITMHGLYAWVPLGVQAAIRDFVSTKLRPGGLVYLSYNAMPGWGSVSPLREYFVGRAAVLQGDPVSVARQVVSELVALKQQQAPFFRENPVAADIVTRLADADPRYVVHEYLGGSWFPRYFTEIHDDFTAIGLRFVAEAGVIESLLPHSVAPAFVEKLEQATDIRERESLRDFIQNRFFRRDVYRRPREADSEQTSVRPLHDTLFGLIADPRQIPNTMHLPDAPSVSLQGPWFERVKRLIGYRVLTLDELLADPELARVNPGQLIESLQLLSASGFCVPCATREIEPPRGPSEHIAVVPRLNAALLARHDWTEPSLTLASPVLGSGITLNALEAALLNSLHLRESLDWLVEQLAQHGIVVRGADDGQVISDQRAARQALQQAMQQFQRYKLPKLAYLGIVVPRA